MHRTVKPLLLFVLLVFQISLVHSRENPLNGRHVRIAVTNNPPVFARELVDGNLTYSGIDYEVLRLILGQLNMTYTLVMANETAIRLNGVSEPLIDMIVKNESDMAGLSLSVSHGRMQLVDFTSPTFIPWFRLILRYPNEESRLWAIVNPFHLTVWILLITSSLAVMTCFSVVISFYRPNLGVFERISQGFLFVCRIITSQGEDNPISAASLRLAMAVWCLAMVVLANSYAGKLTSSLAVPMLKEFPNTLEELAYSREFSLITDPGSTFTKACMTATSGIYKIFGDSLRAHPEHLTLQYKEISDSLLKRDVAFPMRDTIANPFLIDHNGKIGPCKMTYSKPIAIIQPTALPVAKNSIYSATINERIQNLWENGLLTKIQNEELVFAKRCLVRNRNSQSTLTAFTLRDFSAAFFIFGVGLVASTATFLLEIVINRYLQGL